MRKRWVWIGVAPLALLNHGVVFQHKGKPTFYESLMRLPITHRGVTVQARNSTLGPGGRISFPPSLEICNVSSEPLSIDNRLGFTVNVFMYLFDDLKNRIKFKALDVRTSQGSPTEYEHLTQIPPGQRLVRTGLFESCKPVPEGVYTAIFVYDQPFGIGETPLKGMYWTGLVRSKAVTMIVKRGPLQ